MLFATVTQTIGKKVRLDSAHHGDAKAIMDAWQEVNVRDSFHHDKPRNVMEEGDYLRQNEDSPHDHLFLVRRLKPDDRIVGTSGLHHLDAHALTARLGFCLFCQDDGVGDCLEEAIQLTAKIAFEMLRLRCVYVQVLENDDPAKTLFRNLGFVDTQYVVPYHGKRGVHRLVRIMELQGPDLAGK
jgi:RimJ/RimL family protein N-acetyltransferase